VVMLVLVLLIFNVVTSNIISLYDDKFFG